jgi:hypothetical protein
MAASDIIFLILGCIAVFSLILGWGIFVALSLAPAHFASIGPPFTAKRRVLCTFVGLFANSTVLIFPLIYVYWYPFSVGYLIMGSLVFSTLSIVVGCFGLKQVRPVLIVGAVASAAVLLMIPISIL